MKFYEFVYTKSNSITFRTLAEDDETAWFKLFEKCRTIEETGFTMPRRIRSLWEMFSKEI